MLDPRKKYLQIALNSTISEAASVISRIPLDERIIIEAGTPLIKAYGAGGIRKIRSLWQQRVLQRAGFSIQEANSLEGFGLGILGMNPLLAAAVKKKISQRKKENIKKAVSLTPYIVADLKCMDRGEREVKIAREGGASAAVALGHAPIETLDSFIKECKKIGLDSMVDMMNIEYPLAILRKLKALPNAVILHRGVDEEAFNPESEIPYHEIQRIKTEYDIMIAVAGGDTFEEARRAVFNDADIVVVWKSFYKSSADTAKLAEEFLKEIR